MSETRDESDGPNPRSGNRRALGLAALELSGRSGVRELTVEAIAARAGLSSAEFHRWFGDPAACYTAGYAAVVDELAEEMLAAAAEQEGWVRQMRAGLEAFSAFLEAEPDVARGVVLEVFAAGEAARAKRDEVFERLSRAVDTARRETESRHTPPPITAMVILNMIEAAASAWLRDGQPPRFADGVTELLYVAVAFYFGLEEAERRLR